MPVAADADEESTPEEPVVIDCDASSQHSEDVPTLEPQQVENIGLFV